jgi:hypothetical protein
LSGVCIVFLWALLPVSIVGQKRLDFVPNDYKMIFGSKYNDAVCFISKEKWISDSLAKNGIDPNFALAIVFPELIRFSSLQNYIELQGLFTLYVQYGASYANFSVGHFQMKPTFAEQIEKDAGIYLNDRIFKPETMANSPVFRLERVKRLQSINWQVQYLILFIRIMDLKFQTIKWKSSGEKLKFYATAYNCGYFHSNNYIQSKIKTVNFHVALFTSADHYSYCDISASYFKTVDL